MSTLKPLCQPGLKCRWAAVCGEGCSWFFLESRLNNYRLIWLCCDADTDECENTDSCMYGTCVNKAGGYECKCPQHLELNPTGTGCIGKLPVMKVEFPPMKIRRTPLLKCLSGIVSVITGFIGTRSEWVVFFSTHSNSVCCKPPLDGHIDVGRTFFPTSFFRKVHCTQYRWKTLLNNRKVRHTNFYGWAELGRILRFDSLKLVFCIVCIVNVFCIFLNIVAVRILAFLDSLTQFICLVVSSQFVGNEVDLNHLESLCWEFAVWIVLWCLLITDRRRGRCYLEVPDWRRRGSCTSVIGESLSRATCCCTAGRGWADSTVVENACELCPGNGTGESS